jgi:NarL family two-component system response regulator LiaR
VALGETASASAAIAEVHRICEPLGASFLLQRAATLSRQIGQQSTVQDRPRGLTSREVEVLRLLACHRTDKEIAEMLFIGPRTVNTHVSNILAKLEVQSRREAAIEAARLDLL